eukprot:SAG11_NODE_2883_length_2870_cov_2.186214_3_plen_86_part_00
MAIDATLAAGDRATAGGFTDAHVRGILEQRGLVFFEVSSQQHRQNRLALRQRTTKFPVYDIYRGGALNAAEMQKTHPNHRKNAER